MKRNMFLTLAELFFPLILMLLCLGVRKAFKIKTFYYKNIEKTTENFLKMRSVSNIHYDLINQIKTNNKKIKYNYNIIYIIQCYIIY